MKSYRNDPDGEANQREMRENERYVGGLQIKHELELPPFMTRKRAIELLKEAQNNDDIESGHVDADNVLCSLLSTLGYLDVVVEFKRVPKWYA